MACFAEQAQNRLGIFWPVALDIANGHYLVSGLDSTDKPEPRFGDAYSIAESLDNSLVGLAMSGLGSHTQFNRPVCDGQYPLAVLTCSCFDTELKLKKADRERTRFAGYESGSKWRGH